MFIYLFFIIIWDLVNYFSRKYNIGSIFLFIIHNHDLTIEIAHLRSWWCFTVGTIQLLNNLFQTFTTQGNQIKEETLDF